jgi:hypothetical protein
MDNPDFGATFGQQTLSLQVTNLEVLRSVMGDRGSEPWIVGV